MGKGWRFWRRKQRLVRDVVVAHLGPCADAETVSHVIRPIERVNLQLVFDRWLGSNEDGRLVGYSRESFFGNTGIVQLLFDDVPQAPVQRQRFAISPTEEIDCVTRGIYLLAQEGHPIAILLSTPDSRFEPPVIEIVAQQRGVAQKALQHLLEEANRDLVYRGKAIYLEEDHQRGTGVQVRFHPLVPTPRDALVLPEKLMSVIERNVLGLLRHANLMKRSGRSTRHGLLFHGPPGTGKTLMLRYLAGACKDHTVILLTGRQVSLIRESCQVARLLAPAMVLLEDVDLIGQERSENRCPTLLHELMDEMDGLGTKADVIFLLTTNRPEVLEPALSARPGRIDQAIEFPLPDDDCRRKLFDLYGRGLQMSKLDLKRWIDRTRGVSPAFIEELLRKSALQAAERGESADPLPITDEDVERAMEELICFGGELTQKLLGYRPFGFVPRSG
jgi:hypothetical protein